jgi:hypothetical protein
MARLRQLTGASSRRNAVVVLLVTDGQTGHVAQLRSLALLVAAADAVHTL